MGIEEILAALKAIIDGAEGRSLTDDEVERYEKLEVELRAAQKDVEVRSRQKAYDTPVRNDLHVHVAAATEDDTLERAFDHYMRTGKENADIVQLRAQSTTDAAGGFTVPEGFRNKLTERLKAFGGLASAVETITTEGGERLPWPTLDDTSNTGVIAAEGAAPGSGGADLVFGEKELKAFKYVAPGAGQLPLRVSVELLQDSAFDVQGLVTRKLGERIGRAQAAHWATGNGTTEPFGIDTGTTVAVGAGAALTYAELVAATHTVDPDYRTGASWSFNDATLQGIESILDTAGRPILKSVDTGADTSPSNLRLLGYPVVIDQAFATYTDATTNRWGVFGDLRQGYVIRRVRDVTLIVNPYTRANEGQVEYTMWARADGVPDDTNAYRVLINAVA